MSKALREFVSHANCLTIIRRSASDPSTSYLLPDNVRVDVVSEGGGFNGVRTIHIYYMDHPALEVELGWGDLEMSVYPADALDAKDARMLAHLLSVTANLADAESADDPRRCDDD